MADVRRTLYSLKSTLESEVARYSTLAAAEGLDMLDQAKLQEDLRRYYAIRCAGFLERILFEAIKWYVKEHSRDSVASFSLSFFSRSPNLTPEALENLAARFGSDFERTLELALNDEHRERLGALLGLRNDIAHGEFPNGAKLVPEQYLELCNKIYDWTLEQFVQGAVIEYGNDGNPL